MKKPAPANTRPYRRISETGPEMRTMTLHGDQLWRQVGWLGGTGAFYAYDEKPHEHEGGSFGPLWVLVDNDPPILPDAEEQPVRAPDGTPLCTCTYGKRCPACRA